MKMSEKNDKRTSKALFGFDMHDFVQKEVSHSNVELASEFGISMEDVAKLKKQLERN